MQDVIVRTRSYTIISFDELKEALRSMRMILEKEFETWHFTNQDIGSSSQRNSYDVKQIQPNRSR